MPSRRSCRPAHAPHRGRQGRDRTLATFIACAAGLACTVPAHAQVDATWLTAQSDSWFNPARWSTNPNSPNNNNPPGTLYRAIINATGAAYDVTLPSDLTLSALRLDTPNATIRHTGGIFDLLGTADFLRGSWQLNGGTIRGGTINFGSTSARLRLTSSRNNTLDAVTLAGSTTLTDASAYLGIRNGLTITGGVLALGGNQSQVEFLGTQSISGGILRFNTPGGQTATVAIGAGNALTLASGAAIEGSGVVAGGADSSLVNNGRMTIASNARRLTLNVPSLLNSGTMEAVTGGILEINSNFTNTAQVRADSGVVRLLGPFTNTGTITASNTGVIDFAGTIRADSLGTINSTGGTLQLSGTLDNTGREFRLDPSSPNWVLAGTVLNGTLALSGSRDLPVVGRMDLDGTRVTTNAIIRAGTNPTVALRNGGGFNRTASFNFGGTLLVDRSGTYETGTVEFQGTGTVSASSSTEAVNAIFGPNTTFRALPGSTLSIGGSTPIGSPLPSITSRGTITGSGPTTTIRTPIATFRNEGLIDLSNGARLDLGEASFSQVDPSHWSNTGTIRVRNGTVNLAGFFSGSDLTNTDFTGSTIAFRGSINNAGNTLNIGGPAGNWQFAGGEIAGGILHLVGDTPVSFLPTNSGTGSANIILNNVTLNGTLPLGGRPANTTPFGHLRVVNGMQGTGTIRGGGGTWIDFQGSGQFAGNIDLRGPGQSGDDPTLIRVFGDTISPNTAFTFAPTATIRGTQFTLAGDRSAGVSTLITNRGLISSDTPGGIITLSSSTFVNEGTIEATNGGAIVLSDGFVNSGTLRVNRGGVLNLGTQSTNIVRLLPTTTWSRGSGTVNLVGILDNAGQTLTLDSTSGYFAARAGTVRGGEINIFAGGGFNLSPAVIGPGGSGVTFQDTTLNGDLTQPSRGAQILFSNATLHGNVTVRGLAGVRFFASTGSTDTIRGGTFLLDPQTFTTTEAAPITTAPFLSLTLSPTTLIHGGGPGNAASIGSIYQASQATTIINQGTISSDRPGMGLTISPNTFRNQGIVEAINGGYINFAFDNLHTWSNPAGIFRVAGGGEIRLQGRFNLADLGTYDGNDGRIIINGEANNVNTTYTLSPTGGSIYMGSQGRITGGTIASSGSSWLRVDNTTGLLIGVAANGDLGVGDNGRFLIRNSLALNGTVHLSGANATLQFESTQTLATGTINFEGTTGANRILRSTGGSLTLGSNVLVQGGRGSVFTDSASPLINNGRISANVAGQSISIYLSQFTNNGIVEAVDGGAIIFIPPGGFAPEPLYITNAGTFNLVPDGSIFIDGTFEQSRTGILHALLDASGADAHMLTASSLSLGGTLRVSLDREVLPQEGDTFALFHSEDIRGRFDRLDLPLLHTGLFWDTNSLYADGTIRVVPTPATGALFGIGGMFLARRRRARTHSSRSAQ